MIRRLSHAVITKIRQQERVVIQKEYDEQQARLEAEPSLKISVDKAEEAAPSTITTEMSDKAELDDYMAKPSPPTPTSFTRSNSVIEDEEDMIFEYPDDSNVEVNTDSVTLTFTQTSTTEVPTNRSILSELEAISEKPSIELEGDTELNEPIPDKHVSPQESPKSDSSSQSPVQNIF